MTIILNVKAWKWDENEKHFKEKIQTWIQELEIKVLQY